MIREIPFDANIERLITTACIVSPRYIKRILPIFKEEYIESKASRIIIRWCVEYFDRYGKCPGKHIQNIYEEKKRSLDEDQNEWITGVLHNFSKKFEKEGLNEQYVFDKSVRYFKKQKMRRTAEKIEEMLERDKVDEAESLLKEASIIPETEDLGVSPTDLNMVSKVFASDLRFSMSTGIEALDILAGPQKSEWLIMFMGPMKRGKTLVLNHLAVQAAMQGYNAVYINLESGYEDLLVRSWMTIGSLYYDETSYSFDQHDDIREKVEVKVPYFEDADPKKGIRRKIHKPARRIIPNKVGHKTILRHSSKNQIAVIRELSKFKRYFGDRLRIKSFPSYSAGLKEINRYLDALEAFEGFVPHVILIDYLGAMKPPNKAVGRDIYDINSKGLKAMSQERKVILFSAHQGTRKTLEKMNMSVTDMPEDIRVLANIDVLYGLMQTEDEKEDGVIRVNVLAHRFRKFNRRKNALILQAPSIGQFHLVSRVADAPKAVEEAREGKRRQIDTKKKDEDDKKVEENSKQG